MPSSTRGGTSMVVPSRSKEWYRKYGLTHLRDAGRDDLAGALRYLARKTQPHRSQGSPAPHIMERYRSAYGRLKGTKELEEWAGHLGLKASVGGGGGGGGGGGSTSTYGGSRRGDLASKAEAMQEEAREANERRYRQGMKGYAQLEEDVLGELEGLGEAERERLGRRYGHMEAEHQQRLVDVGLYGTGALSKGRARFAEERGLEEQDLAERVRTQRAGAMADIRGAKLGFLERRSDTYPDLGMLANLYQAYGQAQGAASLGYGGGSVYGGAGGGTRGVPARQDWDTGFEWGLQRRAGEASRSQPNPLLDQIATIGRGMGFRKWDEMTNEQKRTLYHSLPTQQLRDVLIGRGFKPWA